MEQSNPYESPASSPSAKSEFTPRFDAGLLSARYLQFFGCLSVVSMIAGALVFGRFMLDLTPIFLFWAANNLKQHGRTSRGWVVAICWLALFVDLLLVLVALLFGTENMTISFFADKIENPNFWQVAAMASVIALFAGIPVWLLNTREAKDEFKLPIA